MARAARWAAGPPAAPAGPTVHAVTRWQVPIVLGAVVAGTAIGVGTGVGTWPERLVVPALIALLTLTFAGIHPRAFGGEVRPHRDVVGASLALNFLWAPVAAGLLGWLLLPGELDLRIGLVMLLVTPCTDWYLVFTASARGNVALGAAILPVNLVLQLALLPLFVVALTGAAAEIPVGDLVLSVVAVLGIPLAVAAAVRAAAHRAGAADRLDALLGRLEPLGLAFLAVAVTAIFAAHAQVALDERATLLRLLLPLALFFAATFALATATSRLAGFHRRERVTLTMTTIARNSPVALAVATAAFPDRPLIALALVVGPLVELPVLAVAARLLDRPRAA